MGNFFIGAQTETDDLPCGNLYIDYVFAFKEPQVSHIDSSSTASGVVVAPAGASLPTFFPLPISSEDLGGSYLTALKGQLITPWIESMVNTNYVPDVSSGLLLRKAGDYLFRYMMSGTDLSQAGGAAFTPKFRNPEDGSWEDDLGDDAYSNPKNTPNWVRLNDSINSTYSEWEVHTSKDNMVVGANMETTGGLSYDWTDCSTVTKTLNFVLSIVPLAHTAFTNYLSTKPYLATFGGNLYSYEATQAAQTRSVKNLKSFSKRKEEEAEQSQESVISNNTPLIQRSFDHSNHSVRGSKRL
jgi:hypothetical protein